MQDAITDLRKEIDDIDERIVSLLNERAALAIKIGRAKAGRAQKPYDPDRERKVLDKVDALNNGPLPKGAVEEVYAAIMTACRELQMT